MRLWWIAFAGTALGLMLTTGRPFRAHRNVGAAGEHPLPLLSCRISHWKLRDMKRAPVLWGRGSLTRCRCQQKEWTCSHPNLETYENYQLGRMLLLCLPLHFSPRLDSKQQEKRGTVSCQAAEPSGHSPSTFPQLFACLPHTTTSCSVSVVLSCLHTCCLFLDLMGFSSIIKIP